MPRILAAVGEHFACMDVSLERIGASTPSWQEFTTFPQANSAASVGLSGSCHLSTIHYEIAGGCLLSSRMRSRYCDKQPIQSVIAMRRLNAISKSRLDRSEGLK